MGKLIQEGSPR